MEPQRREGDPALIGTASALAVAFALAGAGGGTDGPAAARTALARGVGLMGQFEFVRAQAAFEEALRAAQAGAAPDAALAALARRDGAIALLNQTTEGAQERAIAALDAILAQDEGDTRARYARALGSLFLGDPARAQPDFARCAAELPQDAYAHFYAAQCAELLGDRAGARAGYERASALDPNLRSAFLGIARTAARMGDEAVAAAALERFQATARDLRGALAEFKYTRMGPLAMAMLPPAAPAPARTGPLFAAVVEERVAAGAGANRAGAATARGTPAVVDLAGDGHFALFMPAAAANELLRPVAGGWERAPAGAFATPAAAGALFADLDNDGRVDAALNLDAPRAVRVLLQRADGTTATPALPDAVARAAQSRALLAADLDHDGDVDLAVEADGQLMLLMNRLDGSFEARALGAPGAPQLWRNDRLWNWSDFAAQPGWEALAAAPARAAIAFLRAADGATLLATLAGEGDATELALWECSARGARSLARERVGPVAWIAAADAVGDGQARLLVAHGSADAVTAVEVLEPTGARRERIALDAAGWFPAVLDAGGVQLLAPGADGTIRRAGPGAGRAPMLALDLRGRTDASQQMRSNASGLGTAWAARIGDGWAAGRRLPAFAMPGAPVSQGLEPVIVGLAGAPQADFLTLDWPDGVLQTELALAPRPEIQTIVETQRQISSCPLLFAWNGREHAFVTDCLGVGGLGYLADVQRGADGSLAPVFAPPRPWERVRLGEDDALQPRAGAYEVLVSETMEEACYLDAARLVAYDLPAGWHLALDERMAIAGPEPTGTARFYRDAMGLAPGAPAELRATDAQELALGRPDPRFIGRTAQPWSLELRFPAPIDGRAGDPVLLLDGWVDYPYSSTTFAMWQAGAPALAPSIDALDPATGTWRTLGEQVGYPAGMPRQALFPIDRAALPPGCTTLRLRGSIDLTLDRVQVAWLEACPQAVRVDVPLQSARLEDPGFPRRLPGRRPRFDASERAPLWDCRDLVGAYTQFGDCTPLLATTDDAVAIFGAGEELRLRFSAERVSPPAAGASRTWVLEIDGWCKDMDLYTGEGAAVGPLPTRGATPADAAARDALHARFNTRMQGGR